MIAYLRGETGADAVSAILLDPAHQCFAHARNSLADCVAVTLARATGGRVLTSDHHEYDALAAHGICGVTFIR